MSNSSNSDDIRTKREGGRPKQCAICGRTATGFHYQAAACESCKSFFRRSVLFKSEYSCRKDRRCKSGLCRACRYKKCINSGMDPMSVFSLTQHKTRQICLKTSSLVRGEKFRQLFQLSAGASNQINYLNRLDEQCATLKRSGRLIVANSLKHLLPETKFLDHSGIESLVYVSDADASSFHEIFITVEFAKRFDFFNHLTGSDQLNLLKANSLSCSLFSYAFSTFLRPLETLSEETLTECIWTWLAGGGYCGTISKRYETTTPR